jgi:hypothetical protein
MAYHGGKVCMNWTSLISMSKKKPMLLRTSWDPRHRKKSQIDESHCSCKLTHILQWGKYCFQSNDWSRYIGLMPSHFLDLLPRHADEVAVGDIATGLSQYYGIEQEYCSIAWFLFELCNARYHANAPSSSSFSIIYLHSLSAQCVWGLDYTVDTQICFHQSLPFLHLPVVYSRQLIGIVLGAVTADTAELIRCRVLCKRMSLLTEDALYFNNQTCPNHVIVS